MPSRWDWLPWELQLPIIQLALRRGPLCIRAKPLEVHVTTRNWRMLHGPPSYAFSR